jgi:hypothetical protein
MHSIARRWLVGWALVVALLPAGCALPTEPPRAAESRALAQQQHQQATQQAARLSGPRLWFAGFAMNATSKAFEGDLQLVASRLDGLGGPVLRYAFSNPPGGGPLRRPQATGRTLAEALAQIGSQLREGDVVVVLVSTHGTDRLLSVNLGGRELAPVGADQLAQALAPLRDTPTVVLLSACYSGSLLPALQRDNRIVLTAAAADRSSWGCAFESRNTFFIEELMGPGFDTSRSLVQLMEQAKSRIAQREAALKLRPSQPQLWVGDRVRGLAERPLKDWLVR